MQKPRSSNSKATRVSRPIIRTFAFVSREAEGMITEGNDEWLVGNPPERVTPLEALGTTADRSLPRRSLGPLLRHVSRGGHAALVSLGMGTTLLGTPPAPNALLSISQGELSHIAAALVNVAGPTVTVEVEAWEARGNRRWDILTARPQRLVDSRAPLTRLRVTSSTAVELIVDRLRRRTGGCRFVLRSSQKSSQPSIKGSRRTAEKKELSSTKTPKDTSGSLEVVMWPSWLPPSHSHSQSPHLQELEQLRLWAESLQGGSSSAVEWSALPLVGKVEQLLGNVGRMAVWVEVPGEDPLWPIATAAALRSLSATPTEQEEDAHFPWETVTQWDLGDSKASADEAAAVSAALAAAKEDRVRLVRNHSQTILQLEQQLREERQQRQQAETQLKNISRKFRERETKLNQQLEAAETALSTKETEVQRLHQTVDEALREGQRQIDGLEKIVQTRNQFYRSKYLEQEALFRSQNGIFKELQEQVSELLESRILEVQQTQQPLASHSEDIPDDELAILHRLQALVLEEGRQLKAMRAAWPSEGESHRSSIPPPSDWLSVFEADNRDEPIEEAFVMLNREEEEEMDASKVVRMIHTLLNGTVSQLLQSFRSCTEELEHSLPFLGEQLSWDDITDVIQKIEQDVESSTQLQGETIRVAVKETKHLVTLIQDLKTLGSYQRTIIQLLAKE